MFLVEKAWEVMMILFVDMDVYIGCRPHFVKYNGLSCFRETSSGTNVHRYPLQ